MPINVNSPKIESPDETAARLREKFGITLSEQAMTPLPKSVFDKMWVKG